MATLPRLSPKGIREIPYPSEDIIQRFSSKDYSGEISLSNATGQWVFNPPINVDQLEGLTDIITSTVETITNNIVSFPEAPIDDKQYARSNETWVEVAATGGTTLTNPITATIAVGGVAKDTTLDAGTEFETIFNRLFTPYQTSALSSFSVGLTPVATVYEVGVTITIGNGIFTYTNDSAGVPPKDFVITGTGFTGTFQSSPIASSGTTYQYTSPSTQTWTLNAKNAKDVATNTLTFSRASQWRIFFGASSSFSIAGLQQSKLNASQSTIWTATADNANASNYTYIAYPSTFADLSSIIMNGAAPVIGAFTKQSNVSYTNTYGIVQEYKVYKSNATGAFATADTLTLS